MSVIRFFTLAVFALFTFHLTAQDFDLFEKKKFVSDDGELPYRILLPKDFDSSKKYPLLLFLHGAGERGNDNESQLKHGAELFLRDSIRQKYPAIVVFPQCATNSSWARIGFSNTGGQNQFVFYERAKPTAEMVLLEGLLDELSKTFKISRNQRYVGGLSMGGFGTFELVNRNPKLFAAAFPICGGANPKIAPRLKKLDWWVFHGDADDIVPPKYSSQMVDALKKVNARVTYNLYPEVKHNSWDYAFKEPELLPWLFSKAR
ncbi:alpha/beta hydrolase-fold protein [Croceivirga thetidis]|uniref:Phospholipase n=1 Tax=Croceivirga thetidis TaxID=2721623 RepID=A0ABX1GV33_9FLAO|nr:alpha/beta hydrolase-fold protein [Croceivirga thetidis]NKI33484.1 phospholipase [Croceivirga thetidis]